MESAALSKNEIIVSLTRSPHGQLDQYRPIVSQAAKREPEFLAHLIAWNHEKGSVRDSKVALPVYSLGEPAFPAGLAENSYAHLALLSPRDFVRALSTAQAVGMAGKGGSLRRLVERYLRVREASYGLWESSVIQHRASLKTLYSRWHIKPGSQIMQDALYGQARSKKERGDQPYVKTTAPKGSTLEIISRLPTMATKEALGFCLARKIPALVVFGALKDRLKTDSDATLALIQAMSPAELTTNARALEKWGVMNVPALKAAFREGLLKAADSARPDTLLKAGRIADHAEREVKTSRPLAETLRQVQQRQIRAHGGVKGRWLVIGDKSGSMQHTIQIARQVAGHLAGFAETCHLIYVNTQPGWIKEVTGWTLQRIEEETKYIRGEGGTAMAAGLAYAFHKGLEVDGIVVVTDGEDGAAPGFVYGYKEYCKRWDKEPTLYLFRCPGGRNYTLGPALQRAGILTEEFDLRGGFDFYSLPTIIQTLSTRKWGLLDQIMETPLKKLDDVFASYTTK